MTACQELMDSFKVWLVVGLTQSVLGILLAAVSLIEMWEPGFLAAIPVWLYAFVLVSFASKRYDKYERLCGDKPGEEVPRG